MREAGAATTLPGRDAWPAPTAVRLLPTAARLFREKGYAAASTRELAETLGIRKASLYHHISGKDELLEAICAEALRSIHAEVRASAGNGPPERRLHAMIQTHVVSALENRDMHAVMLIELRNLPMPVRARIVERRDAYEALLREAIDGDQDAGRLRRDHDAKHLTLALLNLLNWTIFWYDPGGDRTPSELGDFLATMFLDGARGPAA